MTVAPLTALKSTKCESLEAVGKELDQSAVVNALFETQIKAAVADAKVEYNTRLFNKLDPGAFYTRLQEARSALS